ncbi:putative phosphatidate phosphatase [Blattella germanica]|nr:putative phosphatidate phosphatase [Blattella germanica]
MGAMSCRGAAADVLCVLAVGLLFLVIYLFVPPFHRGFFCDDESIRYPVPITQTVSDAAVAIVSTCVPIVVIVVVEFLQEGPSAPTDLVIFGWTPLVWMVQSYEHIGVFLFGTGIGRLRPHFFMACHPIGMDCASDPTHTYHIDYQCSGNPDIVHEARMSFPSGHSSLSFYAATFLVMYLQSRITWQGSKLLRNLVQFVLVSAAWVTSLSRVPDYMHHWSDVLAGMVIGILGAVLTIIFISNLYKRRRSSRSTDSILLVKRPSNSYNATDITVNNNDLC